MSGNTFLERVVSSEIQIAECPIYWNDYKKSEKVIKHPRKEETEWRFVVDE
jgi:hypothetical protein